ncbi:hypothetical protein LINPERHAP1_LOCUS22400, partial [Linum perenne]
SHPWRGTNFCLQDNYFRRYLSLEKKLYFQCLPSSSLLPTHWRRLSIPKFLQEVQSGSTENIRFSQGLQSGSTKFKYPSSHSLLICFQ